jgi:hypothetical protein
MQVESAQLASTVFHLLYDKSPGQMQPDFKERILPKIYRRSHIRHPIVLWATKSRANVNAIIERE